MSVFQFIKSNSQRILNIDGCLTENGNITVLKDNGDLSFIYFENGNIIVK
jgi:hypothetical protein